MGKLESQRSRNCQEAMAFWYTKSVLKKARDSLFSSSGAYRTINRMKLRRGRFSLNMREKLSSGWDNRELE